MKAAKITAIVLGVVIVVLLSVLIFVPGPDRSAPAGGGADTTGGVSGGNTVAAAPAVSADRHLTVDAPLYGAQVSSPVSFSGSVVGGGWFFEATFPVKVLDANGAVLGQGVARAGGEPGLWMSTGTVPFSGSVSFATPKYASGTVVFEKDNPSGLPQNAGELRIPVVFK